MEKEIKKSYNPFKMWGSYTGMILYPVLIGVLDETFRGREVILEKIVEFPVDLFYKLIKPLVLFLIEISGGCINDGCWAFGTLAFLISIMFLGFLMGWGIHSLIRRTRN